MNRKRERRERGNNYENELCSFSIVEIPKSDNLLLSSYAQPLKKVLTAATQGDITQLTPHVSALSARALRLSKMAEFAATTTEDPNLARSVVMMCGHVVVIMIGLFTSIEVLSLSS